MFEMKDYFDFSDYSKDHFCYDPTNAKVIGKFKDETNGNPIVEFVGLRPKMYSQLVYYKGSDKYEGKKEQRVLKKVLFLVIFNMKNL